MAANDLRFLFTLAGTALVLHRGTDVDVREFHPGDILAVAFIAYGTKEVLSA